MFPTNQPLKHLHIEDPAFKKNTRHNLMKRGLMAYIKIYKLYCNIVQKGFFDTILSHNRDN